jgi:hypothetical protein
LYTKFFHFFGVLRNVDIHSIFCVSTVMMKKNHICTKGDDSSHMSSKKRIFWFFDSILQQVSILHWHTGISLAVRQLLFRISLMNYFFFHVSFVHLLTVISDIYRFMLRENNLLRPKLRCKIIEHIYIHGAQLNISSH